MTENQLRHSTECLTQYFRLSGRFSTLFRERELSDTEREQKRETERDRERERERERETQRERSRFSDLYFISIEFNALQPLYSDGSSRSSHLDPFTVF